MIGKKRLFLIILKRLSIAIVVALVSFTAVYVLKNRIEKIGNALVENKKISFYLEKRSEMFAKLAQDMKIVDGHDAKIESAIPSADNILDFVSALDILATQNSEQHTVNFSNPVLVSTLPDGSSLYSIDFNVSLSSSVFSLVGFLRGFDQLPYFTTISGITLNAPVDRGWDGTSSIIIQGKLYAK